MYTIRQILWLTVSGVKMLNAVENSANSAYSDFLTKARSSQDGWISELSKLNNVQRIEILKSIDALKQGSDRLIGIATSVTVLHNH